jgi:Mg/Co/Ni transporter MgtE
VNHCYEFFYHLTEEASDVIFSNIRADLAIKVLQPIKDYNIVNIILNMPDQIQISTLGLFKENRRIAILKKLGPKITVNIIKNITNYYLITDYDATEFIKNINGDDQVYILRSIKKYRRIDILKEFKPETKNCIVKNLINYQEKWKDQWDDGILNIYFIYHNFPKYYPDTIRTYKGCGGSYKQ